MDVHQQVDDDLNHSRDTQNSAMYAGPASDFANYPELTD